MRQFLVISGNIGVGKSTLTSLLAKELGWIAFEEEPANNPYLDKFYENDAGKLQWGFHSQISFLAHQQQRYVKLKKKKGNVIFDRSFYEDAEVFAKNLYLQKAITDDDYRTYQLLYVGMKLNLPHPRLVLYLKASVETLQVRIAIRGRDSEKSGVSSEYLSQLNALYDEWESNFTLCPVVTVEVDRLDFIHNKDDLFKIVDLVKNKLEAK